MFRTFECIVPDITCGNCIGMIESCLLSEESTTVTHVSGNEKTKEVIIKVRDDQRSAAEIGEHVTSTLSDLGMSCDDFKEIHPDDNVVAVKVAPSLPTDSKDKMSDDEHDNNPPLRLSNSVVPAPATHNDSDGEMNYAEYESIFPTTVLLQEGLEPVNNEEIMQTVTVTPDKKRVIKRKKLNPLFIKILKASVGILAGAAIIGVMLSGIAIPPIGMYIMVGVSSLLTLILGYESYKATFYNLKNLKKEKNLTMDVLYTLSSLVIVGSMIAGLFYPSMPMMMEAGLWIFGFKYGGKVIEDLLNRKTINKTSVEELVAKKVWRKKIDSDEWEKDVDSSDIKVGDIIRVEHGESFPVNGVLLSRHAWLRDKVVTASVGTNKYEQGAEIFSGMKIPKIENKLGYKNDDVIIQVTKTAENSHYKAIERQTKLNKQKKSELEKNAQRYLKVFVPLVIAASIISGVLIGVFISPSLGIRFAVSVLATFCPCVVGTSIPTSMWLGLKKATNNGVFFKNSKALERGSDIDTVVFDLNRTLTLGKLKITEALFYDAEDTSADYYGIVAAIQKHGEHQFAHIIANDAEKKSSGKNKFVINKIDVTQNTGIKAIVGDDEYLIGNSEFLKFHQVEIEHDIKVNGAEQITYIVKNKRVIGHYKIKDPLRPDAKHIVQELQMMGKEVHICTGADIEVAKRYANELGIDERHIYANSVGNPVPGNDKTKEKYVLALKANNKRVAMVGDGENDAAAMTASHFSIGVITGKKSLVSKNARATIRDDNLLPVLTSFVIAEQSVRSAKASLLISLTYNLTAALVLGGLLIGIGFAINPAIGVALMIAQATVVLIIQYGIYRKKMAHIERYKAASFNHLDPDDSSTALAMRRGVGLPGKRQTNTLQLADDDSTLSEKQSLLPAPGEIIDHSDDDFQSVPPLVFAGPGQHF